MNTAAGSGLSGGAASGEVSLAIATGGVTNTMLKDGGGGPHQNCRQCRGEQPDRHQCGHRCKDCRWSGGYNQAQSRGLDLRPGADLQRIGRCMADNGQWGHHRGEHPCGIRAQRRSNRGGCQPRYRLGGDQHCQACSRCSDFGQYQRHRSQFRPGAQVQWFRRGMEHRCVRRPDLAL